MTPRAQVGTQAQGEGAFPGCVVGVQEAPSAAYLLGAQSKPMDLFQQPGPPLTLLVHPDFTSLCHWSQNSAWGFAQVSSPTRSGEFQAGLHVDWRVCV